MRNDNQLKLRTNIVKGDDIIVTIISQVHVIINVNKWIVGYQELLC